MPHVAVVIPVRDRARMVRDAIASVLAQSYRGYELVVVDDGSTDGSAAAAEAALAGAPVPAMVLRQPARGVAAARNAGVAITASPWIAFLDSDDLWLPRKLERQMAWLEARPAYRIAQTEERWMEDGRQRNPRAWHRKEERLFRRSLARCLVSPSAVVVARALYVEMGGFDEAFALCEDYELWLRVTLREAVGLVPERLVVKRGGHVGQLSRSTWGLDRFRVAALATLLLAAQLDAADRDAALTTLQAKCAILANGAVRRGRHDEAERYRALAAATAQVAGAPLTRAPLTGAPAAGAIRPHGAAAVGSVYGLAAPLV
jgi:glycosyltransferase involved in cell wall biosynthesis